MSIKKKKILAASYKTIFLFVGILFLSFSKLESIVVRVTDGDTLIIKAICKDIKCKKYLNKNYHIRLAHVDCPEKGKAFYHNAKQFSSNACLGEPVTLIHQNEYDRYGRLIAVVKLPNGKFLNQELVKNGMAKHFWKYSKDYEYAKLEREARVKRIGIWSNYWKN